MDNRKIIADYICVPKNHLLYCVLTAIATVALVVVGIISENGFFHFIAFGTLGYTVITVVGYFEAKHIAKGYLDRLERLGEIEQAASEFDADDTLMHANDSYRTSDHYVYSKHTGLILRHSDILWFYRQEIHKGLNTTVGVVVWTRWGAEVHLANFGRDYDGDLNPFFEELMKHNPSVLIGYTKENKARYQAIRMAIMQKR